MERTVYSVDQKTRRRKFFEFGGLVIAKEDYEWLKEEACQVARMSGDLERLRGENERLAAQVKQFGEDRYQARGEANRQSYRNRLLMQIIKDHDLYDVYVEKMDEIKERAQKRQEAQFVDQFVE